MTSADESSFLVNLLGSVVLFVPVADTNKELMLPPPKHGLVPFAERQPILCFMPVDLGQAAVMSVCSL